MSTIKINDLELDADLDREAMRKVFGGNSMFGRNSVVPVQRPTGSFQHEAISEKYTNNIGLPNTSDIGVPIAGAFNPGASVISEALNSYKSE